MSKPQLSAFAKAMRKQAASSRAGTLSTAKLVINQSPSLQLFTRQERAGQPIKAQEWRT